ncbi:MAG: hydrogenase nickel incorporation protein HypB [Proteobacteria bacterium]|jgi:hydrogenase nickel incorporation protein HypB|nr:hydrogenase nickel incorporation protein HypB [Pseudomonadota bacterium]
MCRDCGCEDGNARAFFDGKGERADVETRVDAAKDGTIRIHVEISGLGKPAAHVHTHHHEDGTEHVHDHEHDHDRGHSRPAADGATRRRIEIESRVLAGNDREARRNREWLDARGVVAVNLISSPGTGKTLLLERTLEALRGVIGCAVINGDQSTDNDARRLAGKGAPVVQIETRAACHLSAAQIGASLERVVTDGVRLLVIENVGNLVCPAAFDLGEHLKIALLSVTEGEDKPLKYPVLFHDAPACVITKIDLLPHLEFDMARCRAALRGVRPDVALFELSARTGEGMPAWIDYLKRLTHRPHGA